MNELLKQLIPFLSDLKLEIVMGDGKPFGLLGQNEDLIVFVATAGDDIAKCVSDSVNALIGPFRIKSFGAKTLEIYAIFLADPQTPLEIIEKYEQDIRVCRKIILRDAAEFSSRLSFLSPLRDDGPGGPNLDELLWTTLAEKLSSREIDLLRELRDRDMSLDDFLTWMGNRK